MLWQRYELADAISKVSEDTVLWQSERGLVKISSNGLAIAVRSGDQRKGLIFHGHGGLILDTIVETNEGAVGRSIEREINEPFLMLGDSEEIERTLTAASNEDLEKIDYKSQEEFIARAETTLRQFLERGRMHQSHAEDRSSIFAFPNTVNRFDILVVRGSEVVYKAMDMVFVSNDSKTVLKSPEQVIVSTNGKSFIMSR